MCLEDRKRKGLYRVILCVWRIERGVVRSVMSATEREFVVVM